MFFVIGAAAAVVTLVLIARWWLNSPIRTIERYIEQLRDGGTPDIPERREWDHEISPGTKGFTITPISDSSESPISLEWDSVVEAIAFKRDLFSTDRVCIVFRLTSGSEVEVHEEMKGWVALCDALPSNLSGSPALTAWFMEITTPAFAPNPTLLFHRDSTVSLT